MLNKNLQLWLPAYVRQSFDFRSSDIKPVHIIFAVVDHYEPYWNGVSDDTALRRVNAWQEKLPKVLGKFRDADGSPPRYTFFYPEEEYKYELINIITDICKQGYGDVEIHLHHDNDTPDGLREKLINFKGLLYDRHKLLHKDKKTGDVLYGFIHGNWALDNSRKDRRWCGVNNELVILRETGCYADFTLPSAPSETQTRKINSIYYAKDDPDSPKSHDTGIDVKANKKADGDLMLIQGPLALNWRKKKRGLFPAIENGDLSFNNPPAPARIDLWIRQHICVKGRPEWIFVKVYTHGTQEENTDMLLNTGLEEMYAYLERRYNDGNNYVLHYASAWEMFNIIKAAESGEKGNPNEYRDYLSKK